MFCCEWTSCLAFAAAVAVVLAAYHLSKVVRFALHVIYFSVFVYAVATLSLLISLAVGLRRGHFRDKRNTEIIAPIFSKLMAWGGFEVRILSGQEHLKREKCCVVVSNHQSILDLLPMMVSWPRKTAVVAKIEILFLPIFGVAAWLNETIFINRKDGQGARAKLNAQFQEMMKRDVSM